MTSCRKVMTSLPFFKFLFNFDGSRILEAWSGKFLFLLVANFYLTETEKNN